MHNDLCRITLSRNPPYSLSYLSTLDLRLYRFTSYSLPPSPLLVQLGASSKKRALLVLGEIGTYSLDRRYSDLRQNLFLHNHLLQLKLNWNQELYQMFA